MRRMVQPEMEDNRNRATFLDRLCLIEPKGRCAQRAWATPPGRPSSMCGAPSRHRSSSPERLNLPSSTMSSVPRDLRHRALWSESSFHQRQLSGSWDAISFRQLVSVSLRLRGVEHFWRGWGRCRHRSPPSRDCSGRPMPCSSPSHMFSRRRRIWRERSYPSPARCPYHGLRSLLRHSGRISSLPWSL